MTVDEYIRQEVMLYWRREGDISHTSSPWLADFGDNPNRFLEAVPLYMGAVPAIQAYHVYNLYQYAHMLEVLINITQHNTTTHTTKNNTHKKNTQTTTVVTSSQHYTPINNNTKGVIMLLNLSKIS